MNPEFESLLKKRRDSIPYGAERRWRNWLEAIKEPRLPCGSRDYTLEQLLAGKEEPNESRTTTI